MTLLQILVAFIAYTFLWMVFAVVLIQQVGNRPLFSNKKSSEEEILSDLPIGDIDLQYLNQRLGNPHSFNVKRPQDAEMPDSTFTDTGDFIDGQGTDKEVS